MAFNRVPLPTPESFKQEITHRITAFRTNLESTPTKSAEHSEHELALTVLRGLVYRFGYNAQVGLRTVGATLLPGQIGADLSVEVPEEDLDGWDDAIWGYRAENHTYAAFMDLAHEWEEVLANFASEGNWQAYGWNVAVEAKEDDAAQYEQIQMQGLVRVMTEKLDVQLAKAPVGAYLDALQELKQHMERIFQLEP